MFKIKKGRVSNEKKFLSTICFVFLVVLCDGTYVNAKIAPPIIPDFGGEDTSDISNLEIKSNDITYNIKSFDAKTHVKYGKIKFENRESKSTSKKVFDSHWTTQPSIFQDFTDSQYDTYSFEKYVDLPIEVLHSRKVAAGNSMSFTVETTASHTESATTTSSKATNVYWEYSHNWSFSMGAPIEVMSINASSSNSIKVGGNVSNSITTTKCSSTSYTTVYKETFIFDNGESNHDTYFDMNFRQKFRVYFTTRYDFNYSVKEWGSGAFNFDKHWEYTHDSYTPVGTYVYLLPIESPYFELSKYYDNSKGLKEIIKSNQNSNIIYL